MENDKYFDKALAWINKRKSTDIKADHEGFETPKAYTSQRTDESVIPNFSFKDERGIKNYVEIACKTDNPRHLITKWKLLSSLAGFKNGKLFLLAPRGHKSFIDKQVDLYDLNVVVKSV